MSMSCNDCTLGWLIWIATPGQDHRADKHTVVSWAASGQNGCRSRRARLGAAMQLIWKRSTRTSSHALERGAYKAACRR